MKKKSHEKEGKDVRVKGRKETRREIRKEGSSERKENDETNVGEGRKERMEGVQ